MKTWQIELLVLGGVGQRGVLDSGDVQEWTGSICRCGTSGGNRPAEIPPAEGRPLGLGQGKKIAHIQGRSKLMTTVDTGDGADEVYARRGFI